MHIIVNGQHKDVAEALSLIQLIELFKLNPDFIITEINTQIIKPHARHQTLIQENDTIELIRFVGGG